MSLEKELIEEQMSDEAEELIAELAKTNPQKAMATCCGLLVGLLEYQATLQGFDPSKEMKIDGNGESRSITIHAA